jgi:predicted nucleic acid-binding protein
MHSTISGNDVDTMLDYFFGMADLFEIRFRLRPALRDADDDRILELATRANAVIVTFNLRDFVGADRYGVEVMTPGSFLRQIGELR